MSTTNTPDPRHVEYLPLDALTPDPRNPKDHDDKTINASIGRFGLLDLIVRDERTGYIISGHGRHGVLSAMQARGEAAPEGVKVSDDGEWLVPVITGWASRTDTEAAAALIALNRTTELGGWLDDELLTLLEGLSDVEDGLAGVGYGEDELDALRDEVEAITLDGDRHDGGDGGDSDDGGDEADEGDTQDTAPVRTLSLADRFGAAPFTILSARGGDWQSRKRDWIAQGLRSEVGRADALTYDTPQSTYTNWYKVKETAEANAGRELTNEEVLASPEAATLSAGLQGTSVFDPVLTETLYSWYTRTGDEVLDPWAGGSVRGVVAHALGRSYTGIDLRPEQVASNVEQWGEVSDALDLDTDDAPTWIVGDSRERLLDLDENAYDFIIGCPPYYDLEEYSDDPADLSNMSTEEFDAAMADTLTRAAQRLRPGRFAVFVVGNVRTRRGELRSMHRCMLNAADAAGLAYVQDAYLVTPVGTVAVTSPRAFLATRTLGRTHQEIMVFVKGDRREAARRLGDVDVRRSLEAMEDTTGETATDTEAEAGDTEDVEGVEAP